MNLPKGIMLFWDSGTIPTDWEKISSTFNGSPIRGFDSDTFDKASPVTVPAVAHTHSFSGYSANGGVSHSHGENAVTLSITSNGTSNAGQPNAQTTVAYENHEHSVTISTDTKTVTHSHQLTLTIGGTTHIPPYRKIVVIKKT